MAFSPATNSNALVADAALVPAVVHVLGDSVSPACSPSVPPWSSGASSASSFSSEMDGSAISWLIIDFVPSGRAEKVLLRNVQQSGGGLTPSVFRDPSVCPFAPDCTGRNT
eukprot:scaffold93266_cov54-Attheya_sp.AAC.2